MHFLTKIQSRKLLVLFIAVGLFLVDSKAFTGDHLLWVFGMYIGGNTMEHAIEFFKFRADKKTEVIKAE